MTEPENEENQNQKARFTNPEVFKHKSIVIQTMRRPPQLVAVRQSLVQQQRQVQWEVYVFPVSYVSVLAADTRPIRTAYISIVPSVAASTTRIHRVCQTRVSVVGI